VSKLYRELALLGIISFCTIMLLQITAIRDPLGVQSTTLAAST